MTPTLSAPTAQASPRVTPRVAALLGLSLSLLLGASPSAAAPGPDLTRVRVGPAAFRVELAKTEEERLRGLMFREYLPADQGMLFIQAPGRADFWMKNTLIPLDLLYFGVNGTLLQIVPEAEPCHQQHCPLYPSTSAAVSYILEINGGEAERQAIQVGDPLVLGP